MALIWYTAPFSGIQAAIEFDVVVNEAPSFTATVTTHPVEDGVDIADHVRQELTRFTLEGVITNTPINVTTLGLLGLTPAGVPVAKTLGEQSPIALQAYERVQTKVAKVKGGQVAPLRLNGFPRAAVPVTVEPSEWVSRPLPINRGRSLQFSEPVDRVKYVFRLLEALKENGIPVALDTYLRYYPQMVLVSLTAPREGYDSIRFGMEFVEYRTAAVTTTTVVRRRAAKRRAAPAEQAGPKGTGYAPTQREGHDLESIARRLQNQKLGLESSSPLIE